MSPIPNEAPTAVFGFEYGPWRAQSKCAGAVHPDVFFSTVKSDIEQCRAVCAVCPVRLECGEQAMLEEGTADGTLRYGLRAYMTPEQRLSIHRRGGLKGRDPMLLVQGIDGKRRIPPVPDEGDRWSKHHTTLARKVVRWLHDEGYERGDELPDRATLGDCLECNPLPLARVLDALIQDGTLDAARTGELVYRGGAGVVGSWLPVHLRFGDTDLVERESL